MNTTGPVTTVTDELLAELELCEGCDCGLDMDRAEVRTVMSELRRLRAENAELAKDAGRYRWLRENDAREVSDGTCYDCQLYSGLELDAAIDTAMATQ